MDEVFGEPFCANVEHFIHRRLAFRPELSLRLTHPLQLVRLIGPEVSEIEFQKQNRRVPAYSLQLSASYKNQASPPRLFVLYIYIKNIQLWYLLFGDRH